jgi:hypothetical protein
VNRTEESRNGIKKSAGWPKRYPQLASRHQKRSREIKILMAVLFPKIAFGFPRFHAVITKTSPNPHEVDRRFQ